ncbi:MAG: transposase [Anaerolineaceae bacterium]|nr:transposase [Anaerolineaceae bacterium]
MAYNPVIHNRHTIRLLGYDYTQSGAYFITICTNQKECIFGKINAGAMQLSPLGEIAYYQWLQLPKRFANIVLDEFVIMPNHMHGIIVIQKGRGEAGDMRYSSQSIIPKSPASPLHPDEIPHRTQSKNPGTPIKTPQPNGTIPGSISAIVQNYKSLTTRKINMILRTKNKTIWQRNYYEHIIRDEDDFARIVDYIQNNP